MIVHLTSVKLNNFVSVVIVGSVIIFVNVLFVDRLIYLENCY